MNKRRKRRIKQQKEVFCNPDVCVNCIYIGEGDSMCDITHKILLSDWMPTDDYMGDGCIHRNRRLDK
jgi:hypothetical protein